MINNETINAIQSRRSIRSYKQDAIPAEILTAILKAGQAAPYVIPDSRHFSVLQDRNQISRLTEAARQEGMKLSDFHREMFSAPGFNGTYGAPTVVIISGNEETVQYEGVCAASVQNMLIAAQSLGIASCWVYFPIFAFHGTDESTWRRELHIPDGYKPCAAVLLGYGTDTVPNELDERYKNEITYL